MRNYPEQTQLDENVSVNEGTILVVEDDVNLLAGIRDILELENYTILTASDGKEGLEVLQQTENLPDLIVSDIMMPHMDGIEFLMKVRETEAFISIPFIYLTAKGEKSDIQRGKRLGVDDYVVKPFNADDLLVAIKARLDRSRQMKKVQEGREDQLKKNILTILNHEFRTPLTFVVAYSDMLGDISALAPSENAESGEMLTFLEGVRNGADRLRRLIENFILLVELETGSAKGIYTWRRKLVEDWENLLTEAAESGMVIYEGLYPYEVVVAPDVPAAVVEEDYLKKAIGHLVSNACKFSEAGSEIEIRLYREDDTLCFAVKDRGRGIPKEEQEKVWDSFYQINRAHYEDQGTGSGLTIVKGVADLHNGTVKLVSEPGVGSTFTICLPIVPAEDLNK